MYTLRSGHTGDVPRSRQKNASEGRFLRIPVVLLYVGVFTVVEKGNLGGVSYAIERIVVSR